MREGSGALAQEQVFRVKKLMGRRGAPELELLANNFPVYVQ